MTYPQTGYTPENLRHFLILNGLTRKDAAGLLNNRGYKCSVRAVDRWLLPLSSSEHSDMNLRAWKLLTSEEIN